MSDDLISRKQTVKMLRNYADLKCFNGEVELASGILKAVCYIENDNIPTAYDADKVIQKITELQVKIKDKSLAVEDEEYAVMLRGQLRGIADCLEIVKSGGVAND